MTDPAVFQQLRKGTVIPASPLVITKDRKLDERRQRALWRYYFDAGVGGLAIGVHTTQFAIRDPQVGLHRPLLELGVEEMDRADAKSPNPLVRVAGVCGRTDQAVAEASMARDLGYHTALLSLAAMKDCDEDAIIAHCRAVAEVLPLFGFYLQPAVGGCVLPHSFWRRFADIENVAAIKMAPFNRYYTIDVLRAVAESGRDDIALYTGNDDNIVMDLITPFRFEVNGKLVERRIVGGLLGHWAVWTRRAVELLEECRSVAGRSEAPIELIRKSIEVTDSNAAFFDAANGFAGCIAGLHEVLRRQGLLEGIWCLDPSETLGPGQVAEIDRVYRAYPHLNDDAFIAERLDGWLR
jgi:dihydrodipicolinate synthase/N-acetylneuraminate lyase